MKYIFSLVFCYMFVISNAISPEYNSINRFEDKLGHCGAITLHFIAGLITKEARHLLYLEKRSPQKAISFHLYTRVNAYKHQILRTNDYKNLAESNFNAAWPVRFIVYGWNGYPKLCANAAIKDAYLRKGNYNIIVVDWSDYSLDINYIRVVDEIFNIARDITAFTRFLHDVAGIQFRDIYLIGHSLGVHILGTAGKLLKPDLYGVIYALDAAGPLFYDPRVPSRLSPNDALYVESIQSDISLLGLPSSELAHASFYANWGLGQPHCPNATAMEADILCDHFGSLYYFVESLGNDKAFGAIKCESFESIERQKCRCSNGRSTCKADLYMGGDPATPKHGIYYFSTRKTTPFGYGEKCHIKRAVPSTLIRVNRKQ